MRPHRRRRVCPYLHTSVHLTGPAVLLLVILAGCASTAETRPVLYPNTHLQQVGRATAGQEIPECRQRARTRGSRETRGGEVARKSSGAAAVGTVGGTTQPGETSPVIRSFVQKCLQDRGYVAIGWQ